MLPLSGNDVIVIYPLGGAEGNSLGVDSGRTTPTLYLFLIISTRLSCKVSDLIKFYRLHASDVIVLSPLGDAAGRL